MSTEKNQKRRSRAARGTEPVITTIQKRHRVHETIAMLREHDSAGLYTMVEQLADDSDDSSDDRVRAVLDIIAAHCDATVLEKMLAAAAHARRQYSVHTLARTVEYLVQDDEIPVGDRTGQRMLELADRFQERYLARRGDEAERARVAKLIEELEANTKRVGGAA